MVVVCALYHFSRFSASSLPKMREDLLQLFAKKGIKGTMLLADEGINGTVAGPEEAILQLVAWIQAKPGCDNLVWKRSECEKMPFYRAKVKIKKEIVTLGQGVIDVRHKTGKKLVATEWDDLLEDPECIVIDTRNTYETAIGTFKNAIDPKTVNFREFPDYVKANLQDRKNKKVAMFCTGGIRCEKASAYMKQEGFEEVYQLQGGILQYLEDSKNKNAKWEGDCFVFDNRVAVGADLKKSSYDQCFGCRHPITEAEKAHADYIEGVRCSRCRPTQKDEQWARFAERQKQIKLAKQRGSQHLGVDQKLGG
jgi:UPF0176 protein